MFGMGFYTNYVQNDMCRSTSAQLIASIGIAIISSSATGFKNLNVQTSNVIVDYVALTRNRIIVIQYIVAFVYVPVSVFALKRFVDFFFSQLLPLVR
jgi:hypothetical protein